jgi:putative hydrolase of the HAD superfamily
MDVKTLIKNKSAVIFDLFHTLTSLESTWSHAPTTSEILGVSRKAWNEQLLEYSKDRLTGKDTDPFGIIKKMALAIDPAISLELIHTATRIRLSRFEAALLKIPENTRYTLEKLREKNKKIGLISNADVTEIAAWQRSPIASYFDSVIFSCDVGYIKPEKEIYEICLKQLSEKPLDCVFIGDGGSHELAGAKKCRNIDNHDNRYNTGNMA